MSPGDAVGVAIQLYKVSMFLYQQGQDAAQNLPRGSAERVRVERMNQEMREMMREGLTYQPRPDNPEVKS